MDNKEKIREIIYNTIGYKVEINDDSLFFRDIMMDSLIFMKIIVNTEESFNIICDDDEFYFMDDISFEDFCNKISELIS